MLGFNSPAEAVNQRFYDIDEENTPARIGYRGRCSDTKHIGPVQQRKTLGLFPASATLRIRLNSHSRVDDLQRNHLEIEAVWKRVIPDYPFQGRFLDEVFNDVYQILKYMNLALAGFAFVALALAMIGLFGLAAFMAAQRTREIGVRKVLGGQFTANRPLAGVAVFKPVMFALLLALPAACFASNLYLEFFAERIQAPMLILVLSGLQPCCWRGERLPDMPSGSPAQIPSWHCATSEA